MTTSAEPMNSNAAASSAGSDGRVRRVDEVAGGPPLRGRRRRRGDLRLRDPEGPSAHHDRDQSGEP